MSNISTDQKNKFKFANPFSRVLAALLDYFILTPVVSFLVLCLFNDGMSLFKRFPHSDESGIVLIQAVLAFVFLFTFLQAIFIYFWRGTPGQIFSKTYIRFENREFSLFLQAWIRQIGFFVALLFAGIPFLALFYHPHRKPFYDRLTESNVFTRDQSNRTGLFEQKVHPADRRYLATSVSVLMFFFAAVLTLGFWNSYDRILKSPLARNQNNKNFCTELDGVKKDKLRFAIALNLVGVLDDRCLDLEADFVLWKNFSDDRAMAYFAKFVTSEDPKSERSYLEQACLENSNSEGCAIANVFRTNQFQQFYASLDTQEDFLRSVLKYEMGLVLKKSNETPEQFNSLKKFATNTLVKKYLLLEKMDQIAEQISKANKGDRRPAGQAPNLNEKIIELKNEIQKL